MRCRVCLVVVALLLPASAWAQHPCDTAPLTSQTVQANAPHQEQFCARPIDNLEGFVRYFNGTPGDLLPVTLVQGPNAAGMALYAGPRSIQLPPGSYLFEVAVYNTNTFTGEAQLSAKSAPLSLTLTEANPPPIAPVVHGLQR